MSCQETREKLSALADNELDGEERERVRGHLAECSTCRRDLKDQGALDMLLKSCYVNEPPELTLDGIWPTVAERIEGSDGAGNGNGGGSVREGDIVFKSSSAMQMLHIPEVAQPAAAAGPTSPPQQRSGWAWPVALVVASAILTGGFLLYKKMTPSSTGGEAGGDPGRTMAAAPAATAPGSTAEPSPGGEAASQPAVATSDHPGESGSGESGTPGAERKAGKVAAKRGAKGGTKVAAVTGGKPEEAADKKVEKKSEPKADPAAPKPTKKGSDALDSLIDDAIGKGEPGAAAPKKAAKKEEAAKASDDVPEQLSMNQIRGAMNKVKSHVQACYDKYQIEGEARVSFTINPDGSVSEPQIKGKFFGTDTGSCVVAAVKKARFPKFSGKAIAIPGYPFMLQ